MDTRQRKSAYTGTKTRSHQSSASRSAKGAATTLARPPVNTRILESQKTSSIKADIQQLCHSTRRKRWKLALASNAAFTLGRVQDHICRGHKDRRLKPLLRAIAGHSATEMIVFPRWQVDRWVGFLLCTWNIIQAITLARTCQRYLQGAKEDLRSYQLA
jgi:hypothetical protein